MTRDERIAQRDWIDLLIEKAPDLREAGVLKLQIGECSVELERPEPKFMVVPSDGQEIHEHPDPLEDGRTLGFEDGSIPDGLRRLLREQ